MISKSAVIIALITALGVPSDAQILNPTLPSKIGAKGSVPVESVQAGEAIPFTISIGIPAPRDLQISGPGCGFGGNFAATIKRGESSTTFQLNTNAMSPTLDCSLDGFSIAPPSSGPDKGRIVDPSYVKFSKPVKYHIVGLPHEVEVLPRAASGVLEPTVRQFFRTQSAPFDSLRQDLTSSLEDHGFASSELRDSLIRLLEQADAMLLNDEAKYESIYDKDGKTKLIFFVDLDRRYKSLLVDMRFDQKMQTALMTQNHPRLILAQSLKTRPKSNPIDPPRGNGTFPPDATSTLQLLDWNISAYLKIANTGDASFLLSLASIPAGATVSSKRIGEAYTVLGQQTNIPEIKFDYAVWTFKFEKTGCKDYVRQFDPVRDTSPSLQIEMHCGR